MIYACRWCGIVPKLEFETPALCDTWHYLQCRNRDCASRYMAQHWLIASSPAEAIEKWNDSRQSHDEIVGIPV